MMSRMIVLAALLAPFLLGACGHSPETQFLTLDPAPASPAGGVSYRGPAVRIPSVQVPPALDRVEFARQTGPGEMKVEDLVHWSAPLGELVRNTLILDLAQRLPAGKVSPPDSAAQPGGLRASVAVLSFGVANGTASMVASYEFILDDTQGTVGSQHWAQLSLPGAGQTPLDTAHALSALLGTLADRMATDIASR